MQCVPLTQGKVALVDDIDYDKVSSFKWCALKRDGGKQWYAVRNQRIPRAKRCKMIFMHRFILGVTDHKVVDHRNHDGLNNTRVNLRVCTHEENCRNGQKRKGTSRFKGVSRVRKNGKWLAQIRQRYRRFRLGEFDSEIEAARIYDAAAALLHGEYASLNFKNAHPDYMTRVYGKMSLARSLLAL